MKKVLLFIFLSFALTLPMAGLADARAEINGVEYATLDEAVANAGEGETITLLEDTDVSADTYGAYYNWLFPDGATLDLNGFTIYTGFKGGAPTSVWLGNNLTIKNGRFETKSGADYALFLGDETETSGMVLEDVVVSTGVNIYNTLDVTLRNVTATGQNYYGVWLDYNATATIESGKYSSNGVAVLGISGTAADGTESELVIRGGDFSFAEGKLSLSESNANYKAPIVEGGTYDFDVTKFLDTAEFAAYEENGRFVVGERVYDRDVAFDDQVDDLPLGVDADELKDVLAETIKNTAEVDVEKKDVAIKLAVNDTQPAEETVRKMVAEIGQGIIAKYFDAVIKVVDKNTDAVIGNLTELSDKITLSVLIPEDLKPSEGYLRKYYILREHSGVIDRIEPALSADGTTLTFQTDKFSTYAIAYEDFNNTAIDNPNTGDDLGRDIAMMLVFLGAAGIGLFYIGLKERHLG